MHEELQQQKNDDSSSDMANNKTMKTSGTGILRVTWSNLLNTSTQKHHNTIPFITAKDIAGRKKAIQLIWIKSKMGLKRCMISICWIMFLHYWCKLMPAAECYKRMTSTSRNLKRRIPLHQLKKMRNNCISRKLVEIQDEKNKIHHLGKYRNNISNLIEHVICILYEGDLVNTQETHFGKKLKTKKILCKPCHIILQCSLTCLANVLSSLIWSGRSQW